MDTTTRRILIVDDEETLCEVLKLNLENEGYDVDTAFSAEQALTYDLRSYSLVLLDIMMGEISGIKMARMMKADIATADIPIIFCTARDSEDDMVMGLNLGADDYIVKPYTVRNVVALYSHPPLRSRHEQPHAPEGQHPGPGPHRYRHRHRMRRGGNNGVVRAKTN